MYKSINENFTTLQERQIKLALLDNLRQTGHYSFYNRLADFDINIVPFSADPECTAYVALDEAIIYVGEGFITVPSLDTDQIITQLNLVIRHERAHVLLKHFIREMKKIGMKLSKETSFKDLTNIIADSEISNLVYSDEDKDMIRKMKRGVPDKTNSLKVTLEVFSGIVTEDLRDNWKQLSLEEMFDKLYTEIRRLNNSLLKKKTTVAQAFATVAKAKHPDTIKGSILQMMAVYKNASTAPTGYFTENQRLPSDLKKCAKYMISTAEDKARLRAAAESLAKLSSKADKAAAAEKYVQDIVATSPVDPYTGLSGISVLTPTSKLLLIDYFKSFYMSPSQSKDEPPASAVNIKDKDYIDAYNNAIDKYDAATADGKDAYSSEDLSELITILTTEEE